MTDARPALDAAEPLAPPTPTAASSVRPFSMPRTEQWSMESRANRVFEISLALPKAPPPARGYPIIYALDAGTSFATVVETARNQEVLFGPVVVVGIGYPSEAEIANRLFDLTPATDRATLPAPPPGGWGAIGGADAFLRFIQDELKPRIEARTSVDKSHQALFGHSLGGLFVLHALFTRPDAFETYVAGSPSIWWGNRMIFKELDAFKQAQAASRHQHRLLVTAGGLETALSPEELRASLAMNLPNPAFEFLKLKMVANAQELAGQLQPLSTRGLQVAFTIFDGETHNSVIPAYVSRGVRFTLSGWSHPQVTGQQPCGVGDCGQH